MNYYLLYSKVKSSTCHLFLDSKSVPPAQSRNFKPTNSVEANPPSASSSFHAAFNATKNLYPDQSHFPYGSLPYANQMHPHAPLPASNGGSYYNSNQLPTSNPPVARSASSVTSNPQNNWQNWQNEGKR